METQIGESAQVFLGGFEITGFRTISNEYALCIGDASSILSLSIEQFRRKALKLVKDKYIEFELTYECNGWAVTIDAITVTAFTAVVRSLSKQEYQPAINLLESICPDFISEGSITSLKKSDSKRSTEKKVQQKLAHVECGKMEVVCPAGVIDIVTQSEIIEVKEASSWKSAIGQVLAYGQYYPQLKKRIHLFADVSEKNKKIILDHCKTFGIVVTFEN